MSTRLNALQAALRAADMNVADLCRAVARRFPTDAVTEAQMGRVVNGRRGASSGLAAAIEDVLRDEKGPRITASEIARLERTPREAA